MIEKRILRNIIRAALGLIMWVMILSGIIIMFSDEVSAADTGYKLYVGNALFTPVNLTIDKIDNPAFSGKAEFDPGTNTLTLTGFNNGGVVYCPPRSTEYYGIYYCGSSDLNIVLVGNNTVTNSMTDGDSIIGLGCDTSKIITISGDDLAVVAGNDSSTNAEFIAGVSVRKKLVINSGRITAKCSEGHNMFSYGIYMGFARSLDEGILEIKNGHVKAYAGNITGDDGNAESCGIYSDNTVTITGGTVEAVGGSTVNSNSYGIYSENTAAFTGGYVTAKGNTKAIEASFINNDSGFGWTDFEGTQGLSDIPVYTQAGGHNYNYKKIRFPKKYQVTVVNGSGSGFYDADDTVTVTAAAPASGKTFVKWVNDGGISLTDEKAETTTFNMPARDLTVTAEYSDTKKDEKDDREDTLSDKVPPIGNNTYASSKDNFAPVADSGKIKKLVLDFSNVSKSVVKPSDLTMTVIKGSRFKTAAKLKDVKSARSSGGIKVKVNKKTLIPTVKCKSDGTVTLTMDNGVTYTVTFDVQKPKANKAMKKMTVASEGSAPVIRNIKDLFNTDIDSGALNVTKGSHATVSENGLVIDPTAKDSMKIEYKYINKKFRTSIKIK